MSNYISVAEFARRTGKSETYIRRMCRENKVPNIEEQLQNSSNTRYMIDIESEEAQKHIKNVAELEGEVVAEHSSSTITELTERIEELAKLAGRADALEDIQKRESENAKYWQDLYMELQNKVAELSGTIGTLEAELKQKEAELTELKRPMFKKVFGIK